jgi:cytochrome c-type biogenesis protein
MGLAAVPSGVVGSVADVGAGFASVAFSGSMLLAIPVAVLAGLVSFASPCVLPLVPGYLGYLGGMSGASLGQTGLARTGLGRNAATRTAPVAGRRRLLAGVGLFVAGFTLVFVTVGALAGSIGALLGRWEDPLVRVLGVVVVLLGVAFLGYVPFLQQDRRLHVSPTAGLWGAPVLGIVFGLGWAPCIGPTLAAVLALSLDGGSAARGAALSVAYCVGLGLPFLVIALGLGRSAAALAFLRRHRLAISRVGGALLILIGLALVTGLWGSWTQSLQGLVAGFRPVV